MDKESDSQKIQRLENQVKALTNQLIWLHTILMNDVFEEECKFAFEARILALKSPPTPPKQ